MRHCSQWCPGARCKSKTGRHNQDRSRQNASVIGCATRPVLIVATGLGFVTRPSCYCLKEEKQQRDDQRYTTELRNHILPVTLPNVHRFKKIVSPANSTIKSVLKWLLNNPPHPKYVATLPCDNDACFRFSLFSYIDVSQGSVATCLRCGGIVNDDFVVNLLMNLLVTEFWKSVNISRSYGQDHNHGQDYSGLFFWLAV